MAQPQVVGKWRPAGRGTGGEGYPPLIVKEGELTQVRGLFTTILPTWFSAGLTLHSHLVQEEWGCHPCKSVVVLTADLLHLPAPQEKQQGSFRDREDPSSLSSSGNTPGLNPT